jgi:hypothetical protein
MVLGIAAVVMALLFTVLTIVHASRDVTARYAHVAGLYDLAVAGNEMALEIIRQNPHTDLFLANLDNFIWQAIAPVGTENMYFHMQTTITTAPAPYAFTVKTRSISPTPHVAVQARIIILGENLDEITVEMVQLQRLAQ